MSDRSMAILRQVSEVAAVAAVHSCNAYRAVTCKEKVVQCTKTVSNWDQFADLMIEIFG